MGSNPQIEIILEALLAVIASDGITVGVLREALLDAYQEGYHEGTEEDY